jgi:hypothetical protein
MHEYVYFLLFRNEIPSSYKPVVNLYELEQFIITRPSITASVTSTARTECFVGQRNSISYEASEDVQRKSVD